MAITNCIFCDCHLRPAGEKTPCARHAEHVFAKWLRKLSHHQIMNMYVANVSGELPQLMRQPPLTKLTMKGVCRKCNNEWMHELEGVVEPVMKRLFDKTDVDELSAPEIATLARWTAKTAITLSYATPRNAPVPLQASHSLHPDYHGPVRFGFFYSKLKADRTLENGYLQIVYGSELGLVGTAGDPRHAASVLPEQSCADRGFPAGGAGVSVRLVRVVQCAALAHAPAGGGGFFEFRRDEPH